MKYPFKPQHFCALMLAATLSAPASAQFRADGYKPGEQSTPLDVPLRQGSIDANQVAANNDVLNRALASAIEAGNVEGVRQALKAGVSLQFDFATVCTSWNSFQMLSGVKDYTFKEASLGNAEQLRMNNIQTISVINNGGTSEVQVPTFCHKAHMLQAIGALVKSVNITIAQPMRMLPTYDVESLEFLLTQNLQPNRSDQRTSERELQARLSERSKVMRHLEIIELIDANIPTVQKRWYASYARNLVQLPVLQNWLMVRFEQATAQLEQAKAYDEPNHLAWDKLVIKSLKAHIDKSSTSVFGRSPFTTVAVVNGASARALHELTDLDRLARIDHALTGIEHAASIQGYLHKNMYCKAVLDVEKRQDATRGRTRNLPEQALVPVFEKYLTDDLRWFETQNLAKMTHTQIINDVSGLPVSLTEKLEIYDAIMLKRALQREATAWVNKPEFGKILADPIFHGNTMQMMTGTGRPYYSALVPKDRFSGATVRALLASGFDARKLYPNEKAPIDIVMALRSPEREAPYLDAQFSRTDCKHLAE